MGARSLYLRWRPRRFGEVIAQDAATRTLRNAVARGTVAHAYLLCGPRGTGKTSIARILFRALNCLNPDDGEPCGVCRLCQATDAGRAVDLIEMDAASHGGIDDVRDLRERVYFAPVQAHTKVYIVDEAHQLTVRAWDAFLKTLEEPPPRTVFVLATTEAHRVPATIVSRCQRFDLRRIPQGRLEEHLERVADSESIDLEPGVAERLARLARGSLRDGLGMLDQLAAFGGAVVTMEAARTVLGLVRGEALRSYLDALSVADAPRALQTLEDTADEGADLRQFLDEVLFYLRGALLARSGAVGALEGHFGPEERQWLADLARRWAPGQILAILRAFGEIESRGRDEHHVLVRAELATAWSAELVGRMSGVGVTAVGRAAAAGSALRDPDEPWAHPTQDTAATEPVLSPPRSPGWRPPATGGQAVSALVEEPAQPRSESAPALPESASTGGAEAALNALPVEPATVEVPGPPPAAGANAAEARSPARRHPSLAVLQAQWPALVERFEGNLLAKVMLRSVAPTAYEEGLVTLVGGVGALELQRLDAPDCRASVQALFEEVIGAPVRVRFKQTEAGGTPTPGGGEDSLPLVELGTSLFGGRLVQEES